MYIYIYIRPPNDLDFTHFLHGQKETPGIFLYIYIEREREKDTQTYIEMCFSPSHLVEVSVLALDEEEEEILQLVRGVRHDQQALLLAIGEGSG